MQRLYSMFPCGAAGLGLLLLRLQIAIHMFGLSYLMNASMAMPDWISGVLILLSSFVALGLVTPIASLACAICGLLVAYQSQGGIAVGGLLPQLSPLALILLGPGAYALDARIFGRHLLRDMQ